MESIHVSVDNKPLSSNEAWQGKRFKTQKYKSYEEIMLTILPRKEMIRGIIEIVFIFHIKNHKMCDYDNMIKLLQDIIVKKGYIEDDRFIYKSTIYKMPSELDKIEFLIKPYEIQKPLI